MKSSFLSAIIISATFGSLYAATLAPQPAFESGNNPDEKSIQCRYVSGLATPAPFKKIALTFDDGPSSIQTPYILSILKRQSVKAAFFQIGVEAQIRMNIVKEVKAEGHVIGNHTWSHPDFHSVNLDEQATQVLKNEQLLGPFLDGKFFRYPDGNSSCATDKLLHSRGYRIVGWHIDSCDWGYNKTGTVNKTFASWCQVAPKNISNFVGHVVDAVEKKHGGILLMHENSPKTLQKLESIIVELKKRGYTFTTLEDPAFQQSMR